MKELQDELNDIKAQIYKEARKEFEKIFLQKTGFSIGSIIKCRFSKNYGNSSHCYSAITVQDAILKLDNDGFLFCESVDLIPKSKQINNGKVKGFKSWWEYEDVKMIVPIDQIEFVEKNCK